MLYQLPVSSAHDLRPIVRDGPRLDRDFLDDLREFISLRPSRRNDELRMMNVGSIPAGNTREVRTGGTGKLYAVNPYPEPRSTFIVRDHPSFTEDLREFISLRLDRVDPYKESKEYRLQQEKASRLYEKLRESLPAEGQATLLQYGEALGAAHYLEVAMLAEHAFMDGVRLILSSFEC